MEQRPSNTNCLPNGERTHGNITPPRVPRDRQPETPLVRPVLERQSTLGNTTGNPFASPSILYQGRYIPRITPRMVGRDSGVMVQLRQEQYTRFLSEAAFEELSDTTSSSEGEEIEYYSIPVIKQLRFD